MAQPLRIEDAEMVWFITIRTGGSRLWFVNNEKLHERICAYLAKYQEIYGIDIYSFILMGNHYHLVARFPKMNRWRFFKAFNSIVSKLTKKYVKSFEGGRLWSTRASCEVLPNPEDVAHWCFYVWLNPVSSGLVSKISDYSGYNSFSYAARGIQREYKIVSWSDYNNHKRSNPRVSIADYTKLYRLRFSRLPGYEHFDQKVYKRVLLEELETRRAALVKERLAADKGFAGLEALERVKAGDKPASTKTSSRQSRRPLVLTLCSDTRRRWLEFYFALRDSYRRLSERYLSGELDIEFPPGTYRPPVHLVPG